jgi:hypothetical protein
LCAGLPSISKRSLFPSSPARPCASDGCADVRDVRPLAVHTLLPAVTQPVAHPVAPTAPLGAYRAYGQCARTARPRMVRPTRAPDVMYDTWRTFPSSHVAPALPSAPAWEIDQAGKHRIPPASSLGVCPAVCTVCGTSKCSATSPRSGISAEGEFNPDVQGNISAGDQGDAVDGGAGVRDYPFRSCRRWPYSGV